MGRSLRNLALVGIGLTTASFSVEPRFSDAQLAALDPVRVAEAICGAKGIGSVLASRLLIASAYAAPVSYAAPIPLYADLTNSPFPVTSANNKAAFPSRPPVIARAAISARACC